MAAIGDRVGYKDSRYFSQTFAKQVGVKPALYRSFTIGNFDEIWKKLEGFFGRNGIV
ncbi:MAG: AraC family transcriptional regulator [Dorea formicigenerans]